jgi:hypothetical protein
MNAKANIVNLYLAAISPSPGTVVRIGYFGIRPSRLPCSALTDPRLGVCIQTPDNPSWTCSRFIKGTHGLSAQHLSLIKAAKHLQWNALYPLPAIAACLLCLFYIAFLLFRNRSDKKTRYTFIALWISCTIGFAAALIPMMLGQALHYAAPVFESQVVMEISLWNVVGTWVAFGLHLGYILAAAWWHRKIGGAGRYGPQRVDEEVGEVDPGVAQMQYEQQMQGQH